MRPILLAVVLALAGCVHVSYESRAKRIEARLRPLDGKPAADVVLALGLPDRDATVDGVRVLEYAHFFGVFDGLEAQGEDVRTRWRSRDTVRVFVVDGKVRRWEYELEHQ